MLSSVIRQLENFAGVMNFVIFPMFFLSSALYPLWKMQESSPLLAKLCNFNPFTHAVELIRFALYTRLDPLALAVTLAATAVFTGLAIWGYDPQGASSTYDHAAIDPPPIRPHPAPELKGPPMRLALIALIPLAFPAFAEESSAP